MSDITLTGTMIRDLASFAGFEISDRTRSDEDLLQYEYTVSDCPGEGVVDETPERIETSWYKKIAYISDYPEEGSIGLGDEIKTEIKEKPNV